MIPGESKGSLRQSLEVGNFGLVITRRWSCSSAPAGRCCAPENLSNSLGKGWRYKGVKEQGEGSELGSFAGSLNPYMRSKNCFNLSPSGFGEALVGVGCKGGC